MSEQMQEKLQAALQALCLEASRNPRLYQLCLDHPQAALQEAGVALPQGISGVRFVAPGEAVVKLPPLSPEGELSAEDLENVAGGKYVWQYQDPSYQWVWVPDGAQTNPIIPNHVNPSPPIIPCTVNPTVIIPSSANPTVIM